MDNVQNYPGIKILGLGPGSAGALTLQVWHLLQESTEIWLRTRHHPVVADIPSHVIIHSFDSLYESENDFPSVYSSIVEKIIELGRRPEGVVYAVPGHPFVAEATGFEIIRRARSEGIKTLVIEGLSFLEPTFTAIGIDPFPQTLLIDALELALLHVPPFPPSAPAVIAQLHSRSVASEVKLTLNAIYPDEHPVKLIALAQDEGPPPVTAAGKLETASRLVEKLVDSGMELDDIYVDPLVFPVGLDSSSALAAVTAMREVMARFPGVHTICGLTNVSYGLPERRLLNRTFLVGAIANGLDAVVIDPTDAQLMSALFSAEAVFGQDDYCLKFLDAVQAGRLC